MGLFDFFSRKGGGPLAKHAGRVANKRAQANDRWDSIVTLSQMASEEAVEALLVRFTYRIDPSITDQEEKEAAFQGIVAAGDVALGPSREALRKYDVIAWPLKCLEQIGGSEAVVDALLELIEGMDVDYERDPDKKVQTLLQLEERPDARILDAVKRFLDDVNEPARFHAACTLLSQEKAGTASGKDVQMALLEQLVREESGRVKACILDGFHERSWTVPEDQLEAVRANLPTGYLVDRQRKIKRK